MFEPKVPRLTSSPGASTVKSGTRVGLVVLSSSCLSVILFVFHPYGVQVLDHSSQLENCSLRPLIVWLFKIKCITESTPSSNMHIPAVYANIELANYMTRSRSSIITEKRVKRKCLVTESCSAFLKRC